MKKIFFNSFFLVSAIFISQPWAGDWADETQSYSDDAPMVKVDSTKVYAVSTGSYQRAEKTAKLGNTILAVGLLSVFGGYVLKAAGADLAPMIVGGGIATAVAFPVIGIGATTMGHYVAERDPGFHNTNAGWYFYGASVGLTWAGTWLFYSGSRDYNNRFDLYGNEDQSAGVAKVTAGSIMFLSGFVCSGISLYLFERKISKSKAAFDRLTVSPMLLRENGRYAAGATFQAPLSFNFAGD